jgi:hypothetical protein
MPPMPKRFASGLALTMRFVPVKTADQQAALLLHHW